MGSLLLTVVYTPASNTHFNMKFLLPCALLGAGVLARTPFQKRKEANQFLELNRFARAAMTDAATTVTPTTVTVTTATAAAREQPETAELTRPAARVTTARATT